MALGGLTGIPEISLIFIFGLFRVICAQPANTVSDYQNMRHHTTAIPVAQDRLIE
jgi:hypothetical protein